MKGPFFGLFLLVSLASSDKICTWNTQTTDCVGNGYTGTCIDGLCECFEGYMPQGEMCIAPGQPCTVNDVCYSYSMTGECVNERCQCADDFTADGETCKRFGKYCNHVSYDNDAGKFYDDNACSGREYTKWCIGNRCKCSDGFLKHAESCREPSPPTITINGTTMANNSQYNIALGDRVGIRCKYDNRRPFTLHVGQSSYTKDLDTVVSVDHVGDQLDSNIAITCADLTVSLITSAETTTQEVDTTSKKLQTILIVSILGSVTLVGFLSVGILYLVKWKKAMNAKTSPADIGKEGIVSP